ncbi:50S ribosomal protein L30 [Myxococcota bacterium]|nr:50S ribosomal protein L30 [Myxococcota bacterium]
MAASTIRVTLKRSGIGQPKDQKITLLGLGLKRVHKTVELENTPSIRGMIKKVIHLVEVDEG